MFSLHEIDHVAWLLFFLMLAWLVVSVLVDLSGDRKPFSDSVEERVPTDERRDKRG